MTLKREERLWEKKLRRIEKLEKATINILNYLNEANALVLTIEDLINNSDLDPATSLEVKEWFQSKRAEIWDMWMFLMDEDFKMSKQKSPLIHIPEENILFVYLDNEIQKEMRQWFRHANSISIGLFLLRKD